MNPDCTGEVNGSFAFVFSKEQSWARPQICLCHWLTRPPKTRVKLEILELTLVFCHHKTWLSSEEDTNSDLTLPTVISSPLPIWKYRMVGIVPTPCDGRKMQPKI